MPNSILVVVVVNSLETMSSLLRLVYIGSPMLLMMLPHQALLPCYGATPCTEAASSGEEFDIPKPLIIMHRSSTRRHHLWNYCFWIPSLLLYCRSQKVLWASGLIQRLDGTRLVEAVLLSYLCVSDALIEKWSNTIHLLHFPQLST